MKTIVLDTNAFTRDWLLRGFKFQLFEHWDYESSLEVHVPAVVLEEMVANHGRESDKARSSLERMKREWDDLGAGTLELAPKEFDYRAYLTDRVGERLRFAIGAWSDTPHEELARRAMYRLPPFDKNGDGYRDALIWADVVKLARNGCEVVLVSSDTAFADVNGHLKPALRAEIDAIDGCVELVRDFNSWILDILPWRDVQTIEDAVRLSRAREFENYVLTSDFQDEVLPSVESLGFSRSPYILKIEEVMWSGEPVQIHDVRTAAADGLTVVQYDIQERASFWGEFPEGLDLEPGWHAQLLEYPRRLEVEGFVHMVLRVAVLYGSQPAFSIEQISWLRADGTPPGASARRAEPDPNQPSLSDQW